MALASLLPPGGFDIPPAQPSLYGYSKALEVGMGRALLNSALVSSLTAALALALAAPTAYALAKLGLGKKALYATVAALALTRSLPPSTLLVGIYDLFWRAGLTDNQIALALAYQVYALPLVLWILLAFAVELSDDVEAAARVDGAGPLRRFIHVALPS